jgi:hypothetical protein
MDLPKELPKRPVGWTKKMTAHFNFGGGSGSGVFDVFNEKGETMPVGWVYRSDRKKKIHEQGFTLPGLEVLMSWDELREMWPAYLKRQSGEAEEEKRMLEALDD